jgi:DNA polymerase-3 subunit epsilon
MREIVIDTETTGLSPDHGHRVVELACIELMNRLPTGREFHSYLDPERDMPEEAFRIHGIAADFLRGKPKFRDLVEPFLGFVAGAPLVIHNADFDLRFLNAEMRRAERPALAPPAIVDTVVLARQRFPGAQASLDALCRRFEIDLATRAKHGALVDARLLAEVYLELTGGRQPGLDLVGRGRSATVVNLAEAPKPRRAARRGLPGVSPTAAEEAAHAAFVATLKDPIWKKV